MVGERDVSYPVGTARLAYKSADGKVSVSSHYAFNPLTVVHIKRVTPHQWAVYDLVRTIPCGKVTTYKYICDKLGAGSPRSGVSYPFNSGKLIFMFNL
jgi:O6-methylguanine-DNA--protein-cysteine methyltransferase